MRVAGGAAAQANTGLQRSFPLQRGGRKHGSGPRRPPHRGLGCLRASPVCMPRPRRGRRMGAGRGVWGRAGRAPGRGWSEIAPLARARAPGRALPEHMVNGTWEAGPRAPWVRTVGRRGLPLGVCVASCVPCGPTGRVWSWRRRRCPRPQRLLMCRNVATSLGHLPMPPPSPPMSPALSRRRRSQLRAWCRSRGRLGRRPASPLHTRPIKITMAPLTTLSGYQATLSISAGLYLETARA